MTEKLNQRSDTFTIVLNDSGANVFRDSQYILKRFMCSEVLSVVICSVIKHDKDLDEEMNTYKTVHYHVVLQVGSVCRIGTMLKLICELFTGCNENQISIDKCNSLVMQTRYLIHLDDIDKHPYRIEDIATNNADFVKKAMLYIRSIATIDDLITICRQYPKLTDLMSHLGYDNYKKYRIVISDIRKELEMRY